MMTDLQFKLSRECSVFLCLTGQVTQEAIQKLIDILNLVRDTYPSSDELRNTPKGENHGADLP